MPLQLRSAGSAPSRQVSGVSYLDAKVWHEHRQRNTIHSVLLVGSIGLVTLLSAWIIWSWVGMIGAVVAIAGITLLSPRMRPETIMRLFRAQLVDERNGQQLAGLIAELARRAELANAPRLYVVPSLTLNAFAVGSPERAAIAVTEGLLRRLTMREIVGVLAHEMAHIKHDDLRVMGLADVMTRLTQVMGYAAFILAAYNLLSLLMPVAHVPWTAVFLLWLAPTLGSLLQLGLSRAREYDADLGAVRLTCDPTGLASALRRVERYQGHFWEDLVFPGRRIPQPSLLRSHPSTEDRITRLLQLERPMDQPQIAVREEPMVSLAGLGPIALRPRYRFPGVWF